MNSFSSCLLAKTLHNFEENGVNFIVVEEEETEIGNPLDQASFKMDVAHLYGYFHCLVRHGKVIWANHV